MVVKKIVKVHSNVLDLLASSLVFAHVYTKETPNIGGNELYYSVHITM